MTGLAARPSRRRFLAAGVLTALGCAAHRTVEVAAAPGPRLPAPPIAPRSQWGGDLPPLRPLEAEAPGDVRFLLVHHTQTPNGYGPGDVAVRLRSVYAYHTEAKGWPDVAYNFFVDAHGGIWEGRTGSLERPMKGDATGGSQGHALLCCFVGDHSSVPPTPAAHESMAVLLAHLADRYGIDLGAGPSIGFTSRGSNRWPPGTTVTTDPIAGHRDMSESACPGDAAYGLIRTTLLARARALVPAAVARAVPTSANPSVPPPPAAATAPPPPAVATGMTSPRPRATTPTPEATDGGGRLLTHAAGGTVVVAAMGAAALAWLRRVPPRH